LIEIRRRAVAWMSVVALALVSSITSVTNKYAFDDTVIILHNDRIHTLAGWWHLWTQAYWPDQIGAGLYRPITVLSFSLQWVAGNGNPMVFHAVSVVLYTLVCVAFFWLALELLAPGFAWTAAALFAVHPLHVEAVANVVGQAELWAALFMIHAGVVFIRARRHGSISARTIIALVILYALACLSKEHGIVLPLLFGAAELTLDRSGRPLRERITELRLLFLALLLVGVSFVWVRSAVIAGRGEIVSILFAGESFQIRALTMLRVLVEWVRLFFWPAHLSADYSPRHIDIVTRPTPEMLASLVILLGVGALAWTSRRAVPVLTFAITWVAVGLLIPSNLILPTGFVLAERTLFLASVGVPLGVAAAVQRVYSRAELSTRGRAVAAAALVILLALGAAHSASRQRVWHDNNVLFAQTVLDAPTGYKAHLGYALALKSQKRDREALDELRLARLIYPNDPNLLEYTAVEYSMMKRCPLAIPLFRRVLVLAAGAASSRVSLIACLIDVREFKEAKSEIVRGLAQGGSRGEFERLRTIADSIEAATPPEYRNQK
jgi:hypothetical protein